MINNSNTFSWWKYRQLIYTCLNQIEILSLLLDLTYLSSVDILILVLLWHSNLSINILFDYHSSGKNILSLTQLKMHPYKDSMANVILFSLFCNNCQSIHLHQNRIKDHHFQEIRKNNVHILIKTIHDELLHQTWRNACLFSIFYISIFLEEKKSKLPFRFMDLKKC